MGGKHLEKLQTKPFGEGSTIIHDQIEAQPTDFKFEEQMKGHKTWKHSRDNWVEGKTILEWHPEKAMYVDAMDNMLYDGYDGYDDDVYDSYAHGYIGGYEGHDGYTDVGYDMIAGHARDGYDYSASVHAEYAVLLLSLCMLAVSIGCICFMVGSAFGCIVHKFVKNNKAKEVDVVAIDEESQFDG